MCSIYAKDLRILAGRWQRWRTEIYNIYISHCVCMCVCVCLDIYVCVYCIHMYIHIHMQNVYAYDYILDKDQTSI